MGRLTQLLLLAASLGAAGCCKADQGGDDRAVIIFVGDSITAGGDWNRLLGRGDVFNAGVSGDKTSDILARLGDVPRKDTRAFFVMVGINDLSWGVDQGVIVANMEKILAELRTASPDALIVLQSVLPVRAEVHAPATVASLNERYASLCRANPHIRYLDVHASLTGATGSIDARYTSDGLHLSPDGYEAWARALAASGLLP